MVAKTKKTSPIIADSNFHILIQAADTINAATKAAFGESTLGYISFFSTERSAKMVESAPDCFESLIYAADPSDFRRYLGAEGACESLLRENRILPIGDFISAAELEMHRKIFRAGGYTAPLNWYALGST